MCVCVGGVRAHMFVCVGMCTCDLKTRHDLIKATRLHPYRDVPSMLVIRRSVAWYAFDYISFISGTGIDDNISF